MEYSEMKPIADEVADLMKTLAHPSRLLALCAMMEKERSVGELAESLGMRAQAMSQQLAILRNKGLVTTRRDGQTIYYGLASEGIRSVMDALYTAYCEPAQR
ncbi:MAG: metalloregulator ArsR/SmtB family transcription factor [Maricaulis sp.]|jgi:DNA-binding transcriptional ArsR family regulator|uniref:ArsR/SmtB family transcription factor n=1 Tax=Maricaulis sp. TaxID=1486257 RepID=UPI0025C51C70|nr:metalloregulator ArsR/SmtB family transcription factor [Maricaulis sp.]MDM7983077.1 metalloregulator ArsR/SmtB family transcription factor [Maricaulis sp.]